MSATAKSPSVDAILLDVSMPGISGTDLCRQLRTRPEFGGVRIIAYTAHAMPGEREDILSAGFDDILIKPISRQVLLAARAGRRHDRETAAAGESHRANILPQPQASATSRKIEIHL